MEELARRAGPNAAQGRVILAHLGNGASLAAVRNGQSVDTSMSFTPTAGVPMSTRTGDLDPGLVWYLARTEKMSAKQLNDMVNFQSGLLGISETSSDMRDLLEHETEDVRAAEAVALFCYEVKKWIGSFAAALGGIETLVFAGGIGENAPAVRARICDGLGFLGIELEEKHNTANGGVISAASSRVVVRVIHTDEEQMIAKTVCQVLGLTKKERIDPGKENLIVGQAEELKTLFERTIRCGCNFFLTTARDADRQLEVAAVYLEVVQRNYGRLLQGRATVAWGSE
jgi:acetate kinase